MAATRHGGEIVFAITKAQGNVLRAIGRGEVPELECRRTFFGLINRGLVEGWFEPRGKLTPIGAAALKVLELADEAAAAAAAAEKKPKPAARPREPKVPTKKKARKRRRSR